MVESWVRNWLRMCWRVWIWVIWQIILYRIMRRNCLSFIWRRGNMGCCLIIWSIFRLRSKSCICQESYSIWLNRWMIYLHCQDRLCRRIVFLSLIILNWGLIWIVFVWKWYIWGDNLWMCLLYLLVLVFLIDIWINCLRGLRWIWYRMCVLFWVRIGLWLCSMSGLVSLDILLRMICCNILRFSRLSILVISILVREVHYYLFMIVRVYDYWVHWRGEEGVGS
jgi:hypothetical protein